MLDICSILIFAGHLLLVDVAMVGPLACCVLARRGRRQNDALATELAKRLALDCLRSLFGAILLGTLLLGVLWQWGDRAFFKAAAAIPVSRFWFGLGELLFYFVCMAGYLLLLKRGRSPVGQWVLAIAAASNLMLHFPPLFAIIATLGGRAPQTTGPLERAEWYRLLFDPEVMSRVVHVWLASAAVVGLVIMVRARRAANAAALNSEKQDAKQVAETKPPATAPPQLAALGARLALVATLIQIPAGLWVLWQLPEASQMPLLGDDIPSTLMFAASLVMAMAMLHYLAAVALGDPTPGYTGRALLLMTGVVVLMVGTLHRIERHARATSAARAGLNTTLPTTERES